MASSSPSKGGAAPSRLAGRRRRLWTLVLGAAVVGGLLLPSVLFAPWAPVFHTDCVQGARLSEEYVLLPTVLVNSPFGGKAWGTTTFPANFPGTGLSEPNSLTVPATNGTTSVALMGDNLSVFRMELQTVPGPGPNTRCADSYRVVVDSPPIDSVAAWGIPNPTNQSNAGQATTLNLSARFWGSPAVPTFQNGFYSSNEPPISTCGISSALVLNDTAPVTGMTLGVPAGLGGAPPTMNYTPPFSLSFSYVFPPNFGTWEVDNLAAPGGPGGGWAFNFVGTCA